MNHSKPKRSLPKGAWDCHAHVFGPYEVFPLAAQRSYTPPEATLEAYLAMFDHVGVTHGVLVHPSAYGANHEAMLDALKRSPKRLRGIGVLGPDASDSELEHMHSHGVRGLRFTEIGGAGKPQRFVGSVGFDAVPLLASRMKALGWHAQVWAALATVVAALPALTAHGVPVVIDHLGQVDVSKGVSDPAFQQLLGLLGEGNVWVKLTPARNSKQFPDYGDVRPFHDALINKNPHRLIWGSDWPHLNMGELAPDVGHLLDLLDDWVADDELRERILVKNPAALYGVSQPR